VTACLACGHGKMAHRYDGSCKGDGLTLTACHCSGYMACRHDWYRDASLAGHPTNSFTCSSCGADKLRWVEARVATLEAAIKRLLDGNRESLEDNLDALRDALDE
jgi:hypothetical protein